MLRYSATFASEQVKNLVYVLDSYDAFNQRLVKRLVYGNISYLIMFWFGIFKSAWVIEENDPFAIVEVVNHNGELCEVKLDKCEDSSTKKPSQIYNKTKNEIYRNYHVTKIDLINNVLSFANGVEVSLQDSTIGKVLKTV